MRQWLKRPDVSGLLTAGSIVAVALFALWGIGGPLLGRSVLAATDEMVTSSPYREAGIPSGHVKNLIIDDTYTSRLPDTIVFTDSVAAGSPAGWDPYSVGGTPLGAVPNSALFSPLTIPYYLLPTWLAPAYEKLLEIVCAVGACFLFLRRLGLLCPAAILGGLVFASSAFMVVWLDFPQTQVAAFIPALFWTVERFVQTFRVRDAALICLPVAAMLLGGFPAVAGYALLTAWAYAAVRILAGSPSWRRRLATLAGVGLGSLAGLGLAMFQLLPFLGFYQTWLIEGRSQTAVDHIDPVALVTAVAPFALGTVEVARLPTFFVDRNFAEALSYVGAAALLLVLVALGQAGRARGVLPRGSWWYLAAAAAFWAQLIYLGGPVLAALQATPGVRELFAGNYIGRARSVLGFLLAVLAAVGFDLLLRRREAVTATRWRRWLWPAALAATTAGAAVWVIASGRHAAVMADSVSVWSPTVALGNYHREVLRAGLWGATAVVAVAILYHTGRVAAPTGRGRQVVRSAAALVLPLLVAGQGLAFVKDYYPASARDTFYPVTDTHRFLSANLDHERFASSAAGMVLGTSNAYLLRALNGHAFINDAFARLVRGLPGEPIPYPTHLDLADDAGQATSPILDRLGVRYFVTSPEETVFGVTNRVPAEGGPTVLQPDQPVTVAVAGRLRAVGVTPSGQLPATLVAPDSTERIEVVVRDAGGAEVTRASRPTNTMAPGTDFLVAVTGDRVADDAALSVTVTLHATEPLTVATINGHIALSTVAGGDDGLRLVYTGSSVIYERLDALPRIRWASRTTVEPDDATRVRLLAGGGLDDDTVLLSGPGIAVDNAPAVIAVDHDGTDSIVARVNAQGAGYLVVADADQVGWSATVDGTAGTLVPADQGLVAVAVPSGEHIVALRFTPPDAAAGAWISYATLAVLLLIVVGAGRTRRPRPPATDRRRS